MDLPLLIHLLTVYPSNMHLLTLESILQELFMLKIFIVITKRKCLNIIFVYLPMREKLLTYFAAHFPTFGLNTERYSASLHI